MRPEAFISIEQSISETVLAVWKEADAERLAALDKALLAGRYTDAHDLVEELDLAEGARRQKERLGELILSSFLFGGSNASGSPADTAVSRGEAQTPVEIQSAQDQLVYALELRGADELRGKAHKIIEDAESGEAEDPSILRKDDPYTQIYTAARYVSSTQANLTASRAASLGFLSESRIRRRTTYQINEVLDYRTCSVCRYLHGKTFEVEAEFHRVATTMKIQDPQQLRGQAPWPDNSKAGLRRLNRMSEGDMQAAGYGSPPFHPGCRGMLASYGSVSEIISTGALVSTIPSLALSQGDEVLSPAIVTDPGLRSRIEGLSSGAAQQAALVAYSEGDTDEVQALLQDTS